VNSSNVNTAEGAMRGSERRTVVGDSLAELQASRPKINRIRVASVIIGVEYTGVRLSSGQVELAYTLTSEETPNSCALTRRAGHLTESSALELARLALSWDVRSRIVGTAALNALSQLCLSNRPNRVLIGKGNIPDHVVVKGDVVTVVGNMAPMVDKLEAKAKKIYVLERTRQLRDDRTLPDTAAEEILPQSDVVLITGTSIINGTVDRLLELSKNARELALVGPTAGILPTVLFDHGATAVATVKVTDANRVMKNISEGGGVPSANAVKLVIYRPTSRAGSRR